MRAKIIAKDHEVIRYKLNGYPKFIVDKVKHRSYNDRVVFDAIHKVGFEWADVYNLIDEQFTIDKALDNAISEHTV